MKELSIEQKAKRYDELKVTAQELEHDGCFDKITLFDLFPELKESEDERIRKALLNEFIHLQSKGYKFAGLEGEEILDWLEKQGEQKSADKVEPKFHEGDWTVSNLDGKARQISEVHFDEYNSYYVVDGKSVNLEEYDRLHHLWTIADAKEGDVLSWDDSKCIALFKNIYDEDSFNSHGFIGHCTGTFEPRQAYHDIEGAHPATKEQCDLLFKKMKEAGYEWDVEKKELKKIL